MAKSRAERASSGGARAALTTLLDRAVRASDDGVRAVVQGEATRIEASVVAVVLRLALGAALGFVETTTPAVSELGTSLRATESWVRAAGARSRLLIGPPSSLLDTIDAIGRWLDDETVATLFSLLAGDQGSIDHARVSALHEELLSLHVRRLSGGAVALRPGGAWVVTTDVVAQPRALRSKWLQRTHALPKSAVERLASALARAETAEHIADALAPICVRGKAAPRGALVVDEGLGRRRSGSHYTPPALAEKVVARALEPLVQGASSDAIRSLRVCDPAMGSGALLAPAAEYLAAALVRARRSETTDVSGSDERLKRDALRTVVVDCLFGVDKDPVATDLARARLASLSTAPGETPPDLSRHLETGDALVGSIRPEPGEPTLSGPSSVAIPRLAGSVDCFDWSSAFRGVFDGGGGFDACVGNPPWVAYVGRAAQPIEASLAAYYERTNPAFRAYRTLHGLFVRRAAELLRGGGRLGLVLPTSVADLEGYGPTREAHDDLCDVDAELIDFGDGAFEGVFQPCMALTSTRRRAARRGAPNAAPRPSGAIWQLGRTDLDPVAARLLQRLEALPRLASDLFGERGFQTTGDDLAHLRKLPAPSPPYVVPIHEGADISEFRTESPRTYLDPHGLRGRLRDGAGFRAVGVLIRQTARYPIASVSDGEAFRNSILAGFSSDGWSAPALAAYLNSNLVRFYHFTRHRDARQGMPQLKIGHLRALPDVRAATTRENLHALGTRLSIANTGIGVADRRELDDVVAAAFDLNAMEKEVVRRWAANNPLPTSRRDRRGAAVAAEAAPGATRVR